MMAGALRMMQRLLAPLLCVVAATAACPQWGIAQSEPQIVMIVHPSNAVMELKRADVRELFLRRRVEWNGGTRADPVDLAPKLPVRFQMTGPTFRT